MVRLPISLSHNSLLFKKAKITFAWQLIEYSMEEMGFADII